ncbi:hypothetical protein chiPu_0026307 [Chiloscyllium punctatum]|uniref:Uncharacterized protein n=1 Tax=Chiloscyllium punctatum TaxID=137246 RepID=A0A401THE9_CHIPU|nr:hypothetical protein [Chiloscyllium punctatum]
MALRANRSAGRRRPPRGGQSRPITTRKALTESTAGQSAVGSPPDAANQKTHSVDRPLAIGTDQSERGRHDGRLQAPISIISVMVGQKVFPFAPMRC